MNVQSNNAAQAKERLYTQLAGSISRLANATSQTADLCEQLQYDLLAMRQLAGLDAAKCAFKFFIRASMQELMMRYLG